MPNTVEVSLDTMLAQLHQIREDHGEETYEATRRDIALAMVLKPNGEAFVSKAFPDYNIEELKAEAEQNRKKVEETITGGDAATPEQMMLNMMRAQVPNLQNQAQFNLLMGAFDGVRAYLNACFGGDTAGAASARIKLNQALDMAPKLNEIAEKLSEMPEALRSEAAKAFTDPPKEFHEYDTQQQLLAELTTIKDRASLNTWWSANRQTIDKVVDQRLRNELLDSVRKLRNELDAKEES